MSSQGEELCLYKEDSLDESDVTDYRAPCSAAKVYVMFCRYHLLVLMHTWPEVLTEPAVRPVGVVAGTEGNTGLTAHNNQFSQCCSLK